MAGFGELHETFREHGVRLFALTAEDEEDARRMKEAENLEFDILYGLDVDDMEARYGIHVNRGKITHLQPAQFVLDDEGRVVLACYSSGRVGRLDADEALDVVREEALEATGS